MGFLFLFLIGIVAIIVIANLGSKSRRKEEADSNRQNNREIYAYDNPSGQGSPLQEGLIALLIQKKMITKEELLFEVERIKNNKAKH